MTAPNTGDDLPSEEPTADELTIGSEVDVEVGPAAHGGHWVARHQGRVVFVRHALTGERVRARITEGGPGDRFLRADAVEILRSSPDRVIPPCPYAGPGLCGGCDLQHVSLEVQREIKAAVVREQMSRLGGRDVDVEVEPVAGDQDGLRWRTRVEFAVGQGGRLGLRRHRSHDVVPVQDCLIASEDLIASGALERTWPEYTAVDVVAPADPVAGTGASAVVVPVGGLAGSVGDGRVPTTVSERVTLPGRGGGVHDFSVASRGFWQVHRGAPATFVQAVLEALGPRAGDRVADLYAGVGLFSVPLAEAVGPSGAVVAVESDRAAVAHGEANLAAFGWASIRRDRVDRALRGMVRRGERADLVVLDPPRAGARRAVVREMAALRPRRLAYVACDPAALARDTAYLRDAGYDLVGLRAFDAFPMTHHVECVAAFERPTASEGRSRGGAV